MKKFEYLEHTADVKFRAYGKDLEEAFINSAYALTNIVTDYTKVEKIIKKTISIESEDDKSLLYDFLEEFLFLIDTENFLLSEILNLKIENNKLSATIIGDTVLSKYEIHTHVKAITYQQMDISRKDDHVVIQVIPDL